MENKNVINQYTISKLISIIEIINSVESGHFPYPDSKKVLQYQKDKLESALKKLELASGRSNPEILKTISSNIYKDLHKILPKIGFILRSTEPRNNFEIHQPLKRLASKIINDNVLLVLSSEWEYAPRIATENEKLLVGMPASESTNPLLLPLSGHELGHAVWSKENKIRKNIRDEISERREALCSKSSNNKKILDIINKYEDNELELYGLRPLTFSCLSNFLIIIFNFATLSSQIFADRGSEGRWLNSV